jgi:hypothetical protein
LRTHSAFAKFVSNENAPMHKIDLKITDLLQILLICNNPELLWDIG